MAEHVDNQTNFHDRIRFEESNFYSTTSNPTLLLGKVFEYEICDGNGLCKPYICIWITEGCYMICFDSEKDLFEYEKQLYK
mgnify:CR=1 FL=1